MAAPNILASLPILGGTQVGGNSTYNHYLPILNNNGLLDISFIDPNAVSAQITQIKEAVRVATTANITLVGTQTIDGVAVVAGDRVLVKNQTLPAQNGIYVAATGAWNRAIDMNIASQIIYGTLVPVLLGTTNTFTFWVCTTIAPITMGSTSIAWSYFISPLVAGGLNYQGTWNANTNTPTLTSSVGTKGFYYVVSTSGSTTLDGISSWSAGDWAVFNGSIWNKVDGITNEVISVAGRTGAVVLTAVDSGYTNAPYPSIATVNDALNQLLYIPMQINSFAPTTSTPALTGNTLEMGKTLTAITFGWTLNKSATTQVMNPGSISISNSATSYNFTGRSDTTNVTFSLTADDGTSYTGHSATSSYLVQFLNRYFYGTSSVSTLNNSQVLALANNPFATSRALSTTINGGGNYLVFAYPSRFGTATFTVNGLLNTAFTLTVQSVTNASSFSENYNIYVSNTVQNGSGIQVVIS